jgi:thiol-disulfide isomerase/thioredoxin
MKRTACALALLLLALAACSQSGGPQEMPAMSLVDLEGGRVSLESYRGRLVMLNLWATWCPPCQAEIPDFIRLQKHFGPKGLTIVGVSVDDAPPEMVSAFVRENDINYPVLYAGDQKDDLVEALGGIRGVPTTFLVGRDGSILRKVTGVVPGKKWADLIEKHLEG